MAEPAGAEDTSVVGAGATGARPEGGGETGAISDEYEAFEVAGGATGP